jgi:hypothetical protein
MSSQTIHDIKTVCHQAARPLLAVGSSEITPVYSFTIDCNDIGDFTNNDIRDSDRYRQRFEDLKSMNCPVLYWFEIVSLTPTTNILDAFDNYKQNINERALPALRKQPFNGTNILYVGKVKTKFWGRMVDHFGFTKNKQTQGLQLWHWTTGLNLELKVHAYRFNDDMANYMTVLEKGMANKLRPLLGKHQ